MVASCGVPVDADTAKFETSPEAESQTQALTMGGHYRIVSMWSGQAMDVSGCGTANGSGIDQWGYWKGTCQQWTITTSQGGYKLQSVASNRCLDIPSGSTANGANPQLYDCLNNTAQAYFLTQLSDASWTITNQNSGLCIEIPSNSITPGQRLDQWTCNGGTNQHWRLEPVDANGVPTFGTQQIHPQALSFYMIPDFWNEYGNNWTAVQNSLNLLHSLMPSAWVRWDNETGHNYTWPNGDSTTVVDQFLGRMQTAGIPTIIAATAVNGYNNYWAMSPQGTPNFGLRDFASSGYASFAGTEMGKYSVVQMVETANEADTNWFVNDADNSADFNTYMNAVTAAVSPTSGKLLGPANAGTSGNIWNNWMGRNIANLSYHNYNGAAGLQDFTGKQVYVTEYGPTGSGNLDPGLLLSDLWTAEQTGKLGNTVRKIFYQQLFDNNTSGRGRGGFNSQAMEGSHFAFRDYLRALIAYQGQVSSNAFISPTGNDFVATDDGNGNTSVLAWNNSTSTESGRYIFVPGTSVAANATLYVTIINPGDANVIQCLAYGSQSTASFAIGKSVDGSSPPSVVGLTVNSLPAHAAVMVSTKNCSTLTQ